MSTDVAVIIITIMPYIYAACRRIQSTFALKISFDPHNNLLIPMEEKRVVWTS